MINLKKKGQLGLNALPAVAVALVLAAIVFAVGINVTSETGDGFTANSAEANATSDAVDGMANVTGNFPLIGTVVGAVIIIGLLIGGLAVIRR